MNRNGSILILFIPTFLALFALLLFISRWGRAVYISEKAEVTAEATLMSSLRIKAEGLEQIANQWESLTPFLLEGSINGVSVPFSQWDQALQKADQLKKSLPGYKGRIKAVVTVVAEANEIDRSSIRAVDEKALGLDLLSQGQWMLDPSAGKKWAEGLWIQRTWDPVHRLGQPSVTASHEVVFKDPTFGSLHKTISARVVWDVSLNAPLILEKGNGGYPRTWSEALEESSVRPFRYPNFRVDRFPSKGVEHE